MNKFVISVFLQFIGAYCYSQNPACDSIRVNNNKFDLHGLKHGRWVYFEGNSCVTLGIDTFIHGLRNGISEAYTTEGLLLSRIPYKNDTIDGEAYLIVGGPHQYGSITFKKGVKDGPSYYYEYGVLLKKLNFKNDLFDGEYIYYFPSGRINIIEYYVAGIEHGTRRVYKDNAENRLIREFIFENGKRVKSIYYNRKGKVRKVINE